MVATIDAREGRLDALVRPGNEVTLQLTFEPAGWTTGKSFTSTLDGEALTVLYDDDIITVVAGPEITDLPLGAPVAWTFTEVGGNLLIAGLWTPSIAGSSVTSLSSIVTVGDGVATATVTVIGGPGAVINGGGWNNDEDDFYDGGGW